MGLFGNDTPVTEQLRCGTPPPPKKKTYTDEEKINYCMRLLHSLNDVTQIHLKVDYNNGEDCAAFDWMRKDYGCN